jgi:hypothetical protein
MSIFAREMAVIFVLVVLSDGLAAFFAARSCYRLRRRANLAWVLTVVMATFALVNLSDAANVFANGVRNPGTFSYWQALVGRVLRSGATWDLALKLMNGYSKQHQEEGNDERTKTTNSNSSADRPVAG